MIEIEISEMEEMLQKRQSWSEKGGRRSPKRRRRFYKMDEMVVVAKKVE